MLNIPKCIENILIETQTKNFFFSCFEFRYYEFYYSLVERKKNGDIMMFPVKNEKILWRTSTDTNHQLQDGSNLSLASRYDINY